MPRRNRLERERAASASGRTQRVDWFEQEIARIIRFTRLAASAVAGTPDPLGIRSDARTVVRRCRQLLRELRADPTLASTLWNALMFGKGSEHLRVLHNAGEALRGAKRQRAGSRVGVDVSRASRLERAQERAKDVLAEALTSRRRPGNRALSQRAFARVVASSLNQQEPAPDPPYTAESVRAILTSHRFFR